MDRNITEVFSELGRRLEKAFGETVGDVARAARNIARDMLAPEALAEWLVLYPALPVSEPRNVLIIMAGNIPFVGMHDLVCVLAAGHRAIVKPSHKDFTPMSWVVSQLLDIAPWLPVSLMTDDSPAPDAVIAMGGDDAVAAIGQRWAGVPMLLRGNRSSLAVLSGDESRQELEGLADDVLLYSGLGCRNVSLVFVPRDYDFVPLQNIISQRENTIQLKYRNNYRQARAMLSMGGVPHLDCGACLLVGESDFSIQPSILNYAFYDDLYEVKVWMAQHDSRIQCVAAAPCLLEAPHAADDYQHAADDACRHAVHDAAQRLVACSSLSRLHPRAVPLGDTQHPRLDDYPDGRDTMQFLMTI